MADVLIDLGEVQPHEAQRGETPAPRRRPSSRAGLGGLALGMLLLLTGAVHHPPAPQPVFIAARLGDRTYIDDDTLYVVGAGSPLQASAVQNMIVSAYALPDGALLSRTKVVVPGSVFDVRSAGSVILVSYHVDSDVGEATVALTAGTDEALWRHPSRVLAASGPDATVLLRDNTPEFGTIDWAGVDLTTGAVKWTQRQPVRGITTEAGYRDGFPRLVVTADAAGDVEVRDAVSGRITATAKVPLRVQRDGADLPIEPVGDLMLVGAPEGTTAYSLPDLVERWHSTEDLAGRWVQPDCVDICSLRWGGGMLVLDPRTGLRRWSDERWSYADQIGSYLLASNDPGPAGTRVSAVLDPRDGRVRGDFGTWRPIGTGRADGTMVGLRELPVESVVWYALLDPGTLKVRVLGMADLVAGDCRPATDVLICRRLDASVGLWPLK